MKKTFVTLGFALGTTLGILAYSNSVSAQMTNSQGTATGKYQNNEQSTTDSSSLGDFNPLDLIHNANLRRSRDAGQFEEDTNTNLNQAADEFKRLQQQRIQSQPSNPDATSEK